MSIETGMMPEAQHEWQEVILMGAANIYILKITAECWRTGKHPSRVGIEDLFAVASGAVGLTYALIGVNLPITDQILSEWARTVVERVQGFPDIIYYPAWLLVASRTIYIARVAAIVRTLGKMPSYEQLYAEAHSIFTQINMNTHVFVFNPDLEREMILRVMAQN
jgi:hypothetical protein